MNASEFVEGANYQDRLQFNNRDFCCIKDVVRSYAGIQLSEHKQELVYSRLSRRIRSLGLDSFESYCKLLEASPDEEVPNCINTITTNVTHFFREPHHFDFLQNWLVERDKIASRDGGPRKIRIWSAGCSSGEEPYSIALSLLEAGVNLDRWKVRLLATDIDSTVLAVGQEGVYPENRFENFDRRNLKWCQRGKASKEGMIRIGARARQMVEFRQLNLFSDWQKIGTFDFIYCRNVIIYFSTADRNALLRKFAGHLESWGHLILGHSESSHGVNDVYKLVGRTINRKIQ